MTSSAHLVAAKSLGLATAVTFLTASAAAQMVWKQASPASAPTARFAHAIAYDTARQRIVMFGGTDGTARADTWEWNGTDWVQRSPANSPSARFGHTLSYDETRQRTVLFGGWDTSPRSDTWEWDGNDWARSNPPSSPPPRLHAASAYDAARQRVLLFGGFDLFSKPIADTWEWDGTLWQRPSPATVPPARGKHAMAYDAERQLVVMFGGLGDNTQPLADTFEWDGQDWAARQSSAAPPERSDHGLAYDIERRRTVVFGGVGRLTTRPLTWEWDGIDWQLSTALQNPGPRFGHTMAYDAANRSLVMFGGGEFRGGVQRLDDTHTYTPTARPMVQTSGQGCAGTNGVPTISAVGLPILGSNNFFLELGSVSPQSTSFIGLSFLPGNITLGGCTFYTHLPFHIVLMGVASSTGVSKIPVPIPADVTLSGGTVYAQGGVLDSGGAFFNLAAFTAGMQIVIGD